MLTWGDGVSDRRPRRLLAFHRSHGKLATLTAVRPPARFGHIELDGDRIVEFSEKPQVGEGWINGAFFVLEPRSSTTSTATTRSSSASRSSGWPPTASSWPTGTTASGSAWTRCATRSCSRSSGRPAAALEDLETELMRVLVTGHNGYIGSVLVPMLHAAGHEVVGLDSYLYRRLRVRRRRRRSVRDPAHGRPRRRAATTSRLRRRHPPGRRCPTTRSATSTRTLTYDINHRGSVRLAQARQGGRRRALPVLVLVQPLRRRRRRLPRRDAPTSTR